MSNNSKTLFDNSLPRFAEALRQALGADALSAGVVVRDNSGRLAFISERTSPPENEVTDIKQKLGKALGAYARPDRVIAFKDDAGASGLLSDPARVPIEIDGTTIHLIDRRIVGAVWLDAPKEDVAVPPRIVFASLKGGVGRSTALAIAAADLARRNKNVLVVDLDLEAPGVGDLLLSEERKPALGVVDYLVENGICPIRRPELTGFVGLSEHTTSEGGRIDVVPAFGRTSSEHPENVLSKLARALIEDVQDGQSVSVVAQISGMLDSFSGLQAYDAILIDSRAGLAELAAPAILGLGATVLLFSIAQMPSIEGYRALFAGLNLLAQRDRAEGKEAAWRQMLKAVHAKASLDPNTMSRHRDDLYDLFANFLYDEEGSPAAIAQTFTFGIDDPSAPHWPLVIPFNQAFVSLDTSKRANQLTQPFYEQTFRQFMDGIDAIIENSVGA
jgi:cellulose biosynthesis protein BcsQ